MANFNLADYETVDSRIKKFYTEHPEGRILTEMVTAQGEVGSTRWIVKASVYRATGYKHPDATGYAYEVDGAGGMANKTAALENCETSSIGRALANLGYSGDKRASREEMQKADRQAPAAAVAPAPDERTSHLWITTISAAETISQLQAAWEGAGKEGVTRDPKVIAAKDKRKQELTNA